jgi:hypothetical protein
MSKMSYFAKRSYFGAIGRLGGADHFFSPAQYQFQRARRTSDTFILYFSHNNLAKSYLKNYILVSGKVCRYRTEPLMLASFGRWVAVCQAQNYIWHFLGGRPTTG